MFVCWENSQLVFHVQECCLKSLEGKPIQRFPAKKASLAASYDPVIPSLNEKRENPQRGVSGLPFIKSITGAWQINDFNLSWRIMSCERVLARVS